MLTEFIPHSGVPRQLRGDPVRSEVYNYREQAGPEGANPRYTEGMLIIITGSLGVGKTTISKLVAQEINGEYVSIDKMLHDHGLDQIAEGSYCIPLKNFLKANQYLQPIVETIFAAMRPVVLDGCFYHREALDDVLHRIPPPHVVFTLQAPLEVCIERDRLREQPLGENVARAVYHLTSKFTPGKTLDATVPIKTNVKHILQAIASEPKKL